VIPLICSGVQFFLVEFLSRVVRPLKGGLGAGWRLSRASLPTRYKLDTSSRIGMDTLWTLRQACQRGLIDPAFLMTIDSRDPSVCPSTSNQLFPLGVRITGGGNGEGKQR
jgi:hypothetical protein